MDPSKSASSVLVGTPGQRLLEIARDTDQERRACGRTPFFYPAVFRLNENDTHQYSGFIRDVSPVGLGLLHGTPMDRKVIAVTTQFRDDPPVSVRLKIAWCRPCGEGWFISGGHFVE